jgi:hypothetical protein
MNIIFRKNLKNFQKQFITVVGIFVLFSFGASHSKAETALPDDIRELFLFLKEDANAWWWPFANKDETLAEEKCKASGNEKYYFYLNTALVGGFEIYTPPVPGKSPAVFSKGIIPLGPLVLYWKEYNEKNPKVPLSFDLVVLEVEKVDKKLKLKSATELLDTQLQNLASETIGERMCLLIDRFEVSVSKTKTFEGFISP